MENFVMNRDLVLGLRKHGLTFYEIGEKFVSPNADEKLRKKQIENLMCMDGGIIDICMKIPGEPTDLDGMKFLVTAIIENAIDDYGESYTAVIEAGNGACSYKTKTMIELENFFDSELAKAYFSIMDGEIVGLDSKDISDIVRKQAHEGRWIAFTKKRFTRKKDILEFAAKYPKYSCDYYIEKIKDNDWRFIRKVE